ncbi:type II toxin-antitoxin system VapC family toxin [Aliarcobacter butzleri]|uniref:type II toxin-antitoxin system VapC family toxin n=1 Tax=Aliarcobacter butzleri TaxID=28197 RepID=UPI00263D0F55|nr:PIN domain-containing protein [Aliarcobacter butzleri]MDN5058238.1 PIN domain-containing protein [Aliarcobacter butzleri]
MIDVSNIYNIKKEDRVFVDTNILIFLFSPSSIIKSSTHQIQKYSAVFAKLLENKCDLYVNSHVVSEFINRCLRDDFNSNFNINGDKDYKKDYRGSIEYNTTIRIVLKQLKKFMATSKHINDDFESFDLSKAYDTTSESDFNDLIIADTVKKNNLKLLTDDNDFKTSMGIDINWYLSTK